ncbi:transporter substrate-binding domain-containing protein [uncultured Aquitalea sp.]|uniref:substrate-binding periplasmic protein n=1 Tax=uncultured Aquitalea sp. TaxID=540272 RepID=UPI0025E9F99D|nr:transporter substrate-binding domain-containing protein [uncultured Aquitalea sp.]
MRGLSLLCLLFGCLLVLPGGFVLAQDLVVAVEQSDNRPFEYVYQEGRTHAGFHLEVIDAVAARLGWRVVYRPMPWQRALRALELGQVNALSYTARSPEREAYAWFFADAVQHKQYAGLFVLKSKRSGFPESREPCRYAAYSFGAASNYFYGDVVRDAMRECWRVDMTAASKEDVFAKLLAGRVDIAVGYITSLQSLADEMPNISDKVVALRQPRWLIGDFYLAFSRKGCPQEIAQSYVRELKAYRKTPAYRQLAVKYAVADLLP